jgi:DNA helicase HerA-like ATPase
MNQIATDIRTNAAITLDLSRPRAVLTTGKRGSGKTTTLHTLARIAAETGATVVVIDPLGALVPLLPDAPRLAPGDNLLLNPSDLSVDAWLALFDLTLSQPSGIALSRAVRAAAASPPLGGTEGGRGRYHIADLVELVDRDKRAKDGTKEAVINRLEAADDLWNIFHHACPEPGRRGNYHDLAATFQPGVNVVDLSSLDPGPNSLRNLTVSLLISRLFARAQARPERSRRAERPDVPLWLVVDEAHNFANPPALAARSILRWAQEGRNLNLSLALATQRPAALPADVISQVGILVIHRLTMLADVQAMSRLASTYARDLPMILKAVKKPGHAIIVDDAAERVVVGQVVKK